MRGNFLEMKLSHRKRCCGIFATRKVPFPHPFKNFQKRGTLLFNLVSALAVPFENHHRAVGTLVCWGAFCGGTFLKESFPLHPLKELSKGDSYRITLFCGSPHRARTDFAP